MNGFCLRDGGVLVQHGRIVAVGPAIALASAYPAATRSDLGDALLLPGLINAHLHLELSDRTPGAPPATFVDWLLKVMSAGPPPGADGEQKIAAATRAGIAQSLAAGVTTVADITRHPAITRKVLAGSPLRAVSFGEVTAMAGRRHLLDPRIAAALAASPASDRVTSAISPHAPYSIERHGYERCVAAARSACVPIATHLAESADEATFLESHEGPFRHLWDAIGGWDNAVPRFMGGPIRLAAAVGLLDAPPALLAHVNVADDAELALLAAGRASVVYCPRTHAYFGHAPHRWRRMLDLDINVAVGTDSAASSPSLNLVDDLRLMHAQAPDVPAERLWEMATIGGARALGLEQDRGDLAVGKLADFVAFPLPKLGGDPLAAVLESDVHPIGVWIDGLRV